MSDDIEALKQFIRGRLRAQFEMVPSKSATSGRVHLEVWKTQDKGRPVGLEMGHASRVNLWLVSLNAPRDVPGAVEITRKQPKGRLWTDADGDGANSNLSAYDEFRTKPIVCLGVKTPEDAQFIMDHLCR